MVNDPPCKGCVEPVRYSGCHDHCEKYKAWKAKRLEGHEQRVGAYIAQQVHIEMIQKTKKKSRKNWKRR